MISRVDFYLLLFLWLTPLGNRGCALVGGTLPNVNERVDEVAKRYYQSGYWLGLDLDSAVAEFTLSAIENPSECGLHSENEGQVAPVVDRIRLEDFSCVLLVLLKHAHNEYYLVIQTADSLYHCLPSSDWGVELEKDDSVTMNLNELLNRDTRNERGSNRKYVSIAQEAIMLTSREYPLVFIGDVYDVKLYSDLAMSDLPWTTGVASANAKALLGSSVVRDMGVFEAIELPATGATYDTLAFCLLAGLENSILVDEEREVIDVTLHTWTPSGGRLYEWRVRFEGGTINSIRKIPVVRKFGFHFSSEALFGN